MIILYIYSCGSVITKKYEETTQMVFPQKLIKDRLMEIRDERR